MKSNLDALFKTDTNLETDGVWFSISDDTKFLVRRFGGSNGERLKKAMAKHYKPYARQVENGTISTEKDQEISIKVFIETCMVDWKGVEIDGEEAPFNSSTALELFTKLPELFKTLWNYSQAVDSYREDLGNF